MKVMVLAASRHGATREIGEAIGTRLRERGHEVDVTDTAGATSTVGYEAFVLGSAVYAGSWMKEARRFVAAHAAALSAQPVWLFSSGPLDDPAAEVLSEARLHVLTSMTRALDHHAFSGRLDPRALTRGERLVAKVVHAPAGDFRDWDDIARWSDAIADGLEQPVQR